MVIVLIDQGDGHALGGQCPRRPQAGETGADNDHPRKHHVFVFSHDKPRLTLTEPIVGVKAPRLGNDINPGADQNCF